MLFQNKVWDNGTIFCQFSGDYKTEVKSHWDKYRLTLLADCTQKPVCAISIVPSRFVKFKMNTIFSIVSVGFSKSPLGKLQGCICAAPTVIAFRKLIWNKFFFYCFRSWMSVVFYIFPKTLSVADCWFPHQG
jgi:hypothetical protein